ncbi:hypothetical protein [Burkholderia aenigmatica]|uniref:hypothetical protein n=1 Tax=Burkholderia aenigmatica TaxID=2015348 RepID=UPI0026548D98|nr:hypothetical protein [Burkholderia aenigmatica]MDN7877476.1 hypothetical protein [Burkholderia aenigmatica]
MKNSETMDFGKISLRGTYRSKEWTVLIKCILKAEDDLKKVMDSLNHDEVEKFSKVVEGRARCDTFEKVIQRTAIDGSERSLVSFNNAYVPDFITGRLEAFPANLSEEDRNRMLEQTEIVELTEWQVKRGYCYLLARANIEASKDCVKRRRFSSAMNYLCQALMQIGAASARDPAEIEAMASKRKGKRAKDAQDAKLNPVREFAVNLAKQKDYPSYRNAAMSIKVQVIAFAREKGISTPTEGQAEKTITGWLKEGGFAPTPFASKRGTSASKRSTSAS